MVTNSTRVNSRPTFFHRVHLLLVHGLEDSEHKLFALIPGRLDLSGELIGIVMATRKLEVFADIAAIVHEPELLREEPFGVSSTNFAILTLVKKSRAKSGSSERERGTGTHKVLVVQVDERIVLATDDGDLRREASSFRELCCKVQRSLKRGRVA